jgi:alpha-galactosidase
MGAQTLDGSWQTVQIMPDGNHTKTVFLFQHTGNQLNGKVEVAWGNLPLEKGTINGEHFTFEVHMGPSIWRYIGQLAQNGLTVTIYDPNAPVTHLNAQRITHDLYLTSAPAPPPTLHAVSSNGLGLTPPMGWNSWNHFQGHIDDATIRQIADALVKTGMRDAGYVYVNIDDTWEGERDERGQLHPNDKFPDMKSLAGYLHARGLKLGIYSSPGTETCAGYPGSYGHEEQDAQTFAAWGVDYLKYDWCSAFRIYSDKNMRSIYQKMGDALQHAGRPIVFSLCQYGKQNVWTWGKLAGGNLWRTTDDIQDSYARVAEIGFSQSSISPWAKPGAWNDPDMLEIGNGGLSNEESKTHMTLWAMLAAPLIAGNDLRSMNAETTAILMNREVIEIDQDKLGKQSTRIWSSGDVEVWRKPLSDGSAAVAIFNRGNATASAHFSWSSVGFAKAPRLRDLWKHTDVPDVANDFSAEIPAHGVLLFRAR